MPGADEESQSFELDERCVSQVDAGFKHEHRPFCPPLALSMINLPSGNGHSLRRPRLFDVPSIRECFVDLDCMLFVISDGPTKSIVFRQLKYSRRSGACIVS